MMKDFCNSLWRKKDIELRREVSKEQEEWMKYRYFCKENKLRENNMKSIRKWFIVEKNLLNTD
ncbi:MAG: hypothetical protein RR942_06535 [Romboutsia sp.]